MRRFDFENHFDNNIRLKLSKDLTDYSCLSLIRISRGQDFCSNYREIWIIESILQGFLKDGDFTYVPIRERFGLEKFNCIN